jgi:hypothetical protein
MKKVRELSPVVMLMLVVAAVLLFGSTYLPAYAQAGAGDQLRDQVEPLTGEGEGANLVLSSNWQTLAPGEQHVYRFDYDGNEQPIRVWMNSIPASGAQFQIWTDELVTQLNSDPQLTPLATSEPISDGSEFSVWQSNSPQPQIYYVTVRSMDDANTVQYQLNITSPGLSANQPGLAQPTPVPPTATPVPAEPAEIPTTAAEIPTATAAISTEPTPTPAPNITVVPAATQDPNLAIVTAPALNVRSGPSTAYPVITTVPAGTALTVLGRNDVNTWIAVRLQDGTEGWVTRSLTNYVALAVVILTPEPLPTPTLIPGVTATPTPDTAIIVVQPATPEPLDGDWKVIHEGETQWYTFQYRGGGLSVHVWMDVEPDQGAIFNILDRQTAEAVLAGVAPNVVNAVGRGTANPVEPGYLFWRADFPEADIYYVMVQYKGPGDVVYAIHAAGPGLSRPVPQ